MTPVQKIALTYVLGYIDSSEACKPYKFVLHDMLAEARRTVSGQDAPRALTNSLYQILTQQNIVMGEAYLTLKVVGAPPSEDEFSDAVTRILTAAGAK